MPTREFGAEQKVDELPTGSGPLELVGLVMQMQREQMHWMAEQQRRQSSKSVLTGFLGRCMQYWLKNH